MWNVFSWKHSLILMWKILWFLISLIWFHYAWNNSGMQRFRIFTNLIHRETYLWKIERKINFKAENVINVNYYRCCMPFNLARFIFTLTSSFMLFKSLNWFILFQETRNNLINTHKSHNAEFDGASEEGGEKKGIFITFFIERESEPYTFLSKTQSFFFFFFFLK